MKFGSNITAKILLKFAVLFGGIGAQAFADDPDEIFFHTNYADALAEAKRTQKPIFLEFRCAP
ncbi:MAG: hypothetical protein AAF939_16500 [Planctomycetota bacterium]